MQIKIVIGTVAFMIAMMVLGFAALREPARLAAYTLAREARQIEAGAHLYKNNCVSCHGINGDALEGCLNPNTGGSDCIGLQINTAQLLCVPEGAETTPRLEAMMWTGSVESYIKAVVTVGRNQMPVWSSRFGGPFREDQVENVSKFVANWASEELCSQPIITYDWPEAFADLLVEFPEGDPEVGASLYMTYGCAGCHGNLEDPATAVVGPWQGDLAQTSPTRIPGVSGVQYIYESILYPSDYIVEQCPNGPCSGPPSSMPANFGLRMAPNPQEMVDLMAYLLGPDLVADDGVR